MASDPQAARATSEPEPRRGSPALLFAARWSPERVIREVAVRLRGLDQLPAGRRVELHYSRLQIEGPEGSIPRAVEIDAESIHPGGSLRIDQAPLPDDCEVIGIWFANPLATVSGEAEPGPFQTHSGQ